MFNKDDVEFFTSEKSIEDNCSIKTGVQRWNRLF